MSYDNNSNSQTSTFQRLLGAIHTGCREIRPDLDYVYNSRLTALNSFAVPLLYGSLLVGLVVATVVYIGWVLVPLFCWDAQRVDQLLKVYYIAVAIVPPFFFLGHGMQSLWR